VENGPRIVLQKKEGSVGQPIPGSLISTALESAKDIEPQINARLVWIDSPSLR
jgi:hypothetical protein